MYSPNLPEYPLAVLGVLSIGGIVTTANPSYTIDELSHQLSDSEAQYIVAVPQNHDKARAAAARCKTVKDIFIIDPTSGKGDFSRLVDDDGARFPENVNINPMEDVALQPYSSGTTGLAKGVCLTHSNIVNNMEMAYAQPGLINTGPEDTSIAVLPFFHIFGMAQVMFSLLRNGAKIVTMPRFDKDMYLSLIQKHKATFNCVVPPIVLFLAKDPMVENYDLSSLRDMLCGAAPLSQDMEESLRRRLGKDCIRQGYGLTETSPVTHMCPQRTGKRGSIGVLLPNSQAKIVDLETGFSLGPNQDGEVCMRGPHIMKGYHRNLKATENCIKDGWFHSGDIGHYDEDGYFYIVDRVKELIKYKGFQVPPAELEGLLLAHPSIADAAVIGIPDKEAGELPKGFVVLKPNCHLTEEDIVSYVTGHVANYKRLRGGVTIMDAIPKTASGKILRRVLRTVSFSKSRETRQHSKL
ncbi:uncharacterized protein LOC135484756 isoform X2 [Lineus longissimus]|uniref:uncharacterized protein LOC135484756 isoform X2 n=2 Tax=Lineus longissimus TaxID=88925 RepID=UPI00315DD98E